jgi:hypothetical protein
MVLLLANERGKRETRTKTTTSKKKKKCVDVTLTSRVTLKTTKSSVIYSNELGVLIIHNNKLSFLRIDQKHKSILLKREAQHPV